MRFGGRRTSSNVGMQTGGGRGFGFPMGGGGVRIGGARVDKAHHAVRVGDVLTFAQARRIRVVRVRALSSRRRGLPS